MRDRQPRSEPAADRYEKMISMSSSGRSVSATAAGGAVASRLVPAMPALVQGAVPSCAGSSRAWVGCGPVDTGTRGALAASAEPSGCDDASNVVILVLRAVAGDADVDGVELAGCAVPSNKMASNSA